MNLVERDDRVIAKAQRLRFSPAVTARGAGSYLYEEDGRKLIDFTSCWGATGLGNAHPAVVKAVADAVTSGAGGANLSAVNPYAVQLAEELLKIAPGAHTRKVLFGHSGTDANEAAIRLARQFTERNRFLAFEGGYHGGFGAARAVSGVQEVDDDERGIVTLLPHPQSASEAADVLSVIERELATSEYAAFLVEVVQCDGGVNLLPSGFLPQVAALCRKGGTLFLIDEVKTGLGRSGHILTFEGEGLVPDLITFGKALGNGLPISAVVGRAEIMDISTASCILTTAGNPTSAAAGLAVIETVLEKGLLENVRERSAQFFREFTEKVQTGAAGLQDAIVDTRGKGLNIGVELQDPRSPGDAGAAHAFTKRVILRAYQLGLLVYYVADRVIEVTPPLTISSETMAEGIDHILRAVTDVLDGWEDQELMAAYQGW